MKKFIWAALALSLFVVPSYAQSTPAVDAGVGYSYFHVGGSNGTNLNGASGSIAFNVNQYAGVVADLGVYRGSPGGVGLTATSYTFGPRFSYRSDKVTPFFQALFGGSHFSAAGASSNPFTYSIGGGADLPVGTSGKVSLRPEFDYVGLHQNSNTTNCVRIAIGLVFHLGQK